MNSRSLLLSRLLVAALALSSLFALVGCNPAGDETNPISPEEMSRLRKMEGESRAGGATPTPPSSSGTR